MQKTLVFILILILLQALSVQHALAERRVALVIGNSDYKVAPLVNPRNDASDVAAILRENLGFETTLILDADQRSLEIAIRDFGKSMLEADIRVFYYAGHGVSVNGTNYLIPIGADIQNEDDVMFEAVDTSLVLARMESAKNGANLMILDACRDNPLPRSTRSHKQGLNSMQAPVGSLILYATAPGQVALDGTGRNGTFTKHLLKSLDAPNVHIGDIAIDVRVAVMQETNSAQVPWSESSLTARIYLAGIKESSASGNDSDTVNDPDSNSEELLVTERSDYELEMVDAYRKAAESGDSIAQARLGYMYETGRFLEQDYFLAKAWYEKAALAGEIDAVVNLGVMYKYGKGVKKDVNKAFKLFARASQNNHPVGHLNLGIMYQFGESVPVDYAKSLHLYQLAAIKGNRDAFMGLGDIYSYGLGVDLNYEESSIWYRKAAKQGSAAGQSELGYFYEQGLGVEQDYNQARLWFEKAAAQGYPLAIYNLAELYEYGRGVVRNPEKAKELYESLAENGDARAIQAIDRLASAEASSEQ